MSSSQLQPAGVDSEAEITPGTWAAIMEERRNIEPSRLMFPCITVDRIPKKIRRWYPFGLEGVPPGFMARPDGTPFFHRPRLEELICRRHTIAERQAFETGLPFRFNLDNGKIDLPSDVQVPDSRQSLKRKRVLSPSPASPTSARQVIARRMFPHDTNCMFPSQENLEYMGYMKYMSRREGGSSMGMLDYNVQPPSPSNEPSAAQPERRSRALCSPPGPGSSRDRTPNRSKVRSDSTSSAQDPQPRLPKPPVPLYPWK